MAGEGDLCPGWSKHRSKKNPGEVYYFNCLTGASTYNRAEATESAPTVEVSLAVTREEVVLLAKDHKEEVETLEGGGDKVTFQITIEGKTAQETASKFESILKASRVPLKDLKVTKKEKFDDPEVEVLESSGGKNPGSLESSVKKSCSDDDKLKKSKTEVKNLDHILHGETKLYTPFWIHSTSHENYEKIQTSKHLKVSKSKVEHYDGVLSTKLAPRGVWFIGSYENGELVTRAIYPTGTKDQKLQGLVGEVKNLLSIDFQWAVFRMKPKVEEGKWKVEHYAICVREGPEYLWLKEEERKGRKVKGRK